MAVAHIHCLKDQANILSKLIFQMSLITIILIVCEGSVIQDLLKRLGDHV